MTEYGADEVVILSTAFSLISIIVAVFTVITQKAVMQNQSFIVIGFDVKDQCIRAKMARKINDVIKGISAILGVDKRAINIELGHFVSGGGIHLDIQVDVNGNVESEYRQSVQRAIDSGSVAELFQVQWRLRNVPIVSGLTCTQMAKDNELESDIKMLVSLTTMHEKVRSQSM